MAGFVRPWKFRKLLFSHWMFVADESYINEHVSAARTG
jgi:hypothetical protein